ncbi:MAG TPA: hypothetical protein PLS55_04265 [Thermogutta sp.]|nr:hypothetical protein [Thermogutta sp.]
MANLRIFMQESFRGLVGVVLLSAILAAPCSMMTELAALGEISKSPVGENLIVNGDFEMEPMTSPPVGWVMWGAQRFKIAENYRPDLEICHSGRASLRVFHPQDTAGYIVTDPQMAIRPEMGMIYEISFFARADRPCRGRFMVLGYHSIRPFVDAESPLSTEISLGTDWQQYHFQIRESIDFFYDSARYLILGFQASVDPKVECIMWLDDVVATRKPMEPGTRLINPLSLKVSPLVHRLTPGPSLEVVADLGCPSRPALKAACGISFHRLNGFTGYPYDATGQYVLPNPLEKAIRELRLPMSRFYGVGHEPARSDLPPWPVEVAIDRLAELCDRLQIPQEAMVIELEEQSANRKLDAEVWAKAVQHARSKGYRFRYWEVANEPYSQTFGSQQPMGRAFATSDDYIAHVKSVATAIRMIDPQAQVGVAIAISRPLWGNYVLKHAAEYYDFVVAHYYGFENAYRSSFEELVLGQNYRILERIARCQALIDAYNPGRHVCQLDTEWGMHSSGPEGERADYALRNANIIGVVHRAVRMIYYVREQPLAGASSWQMLGHSRGLGFTVLATDRPDSRTMLYWLYYYFLRHVGDNLVDFVGTAPFYPAIDHKTEDAATGPVTPVLLTTDTRQQCVFCIIANGSWSNDVPCRFLLKNYPGRLVSKVLLSDDDLDRNPLLNTKDGFVRDIQMNVEVDRQSKSTIVTGTIPARSVVFLTLERLP